MTKFLIFAETKFFDVLCDMVEGFFFLESERALSDVFGEQFGEHKTKRFFFAVIFGQSWACLYAPY
jgi:hypothetical protein